MSVVLLALAVPTLTITPATLVTDEDKPLSTTLQADVPGARFSITKPARRGTATLNEKTGALTYVAWPDFHGSDRIRVEVTAGSQTTKLDIPITIQSVNDLPVVEPLKLSAREDGSASAALKVSDVDRDKPRFTIGAQPARGSATVDAKGRVTFTPTPNASGADRVVVVVDDGHDKVEVAVDIDVAAVNDAPVIAPGARIDGAEDAPASTTVVASDVDGDALTWELRRAPKHGAAAVDAKRGVVTFTPDANWSGDTSLTVRVSDGSAKVDVDVPVRVAAVDDPTTVQPLKLNTAEDTAVAGALDVREVDGDKLAFTVKAAPSSGTASVDGKGRVTYTPAPNANGADRFTVEVNDGAAVVEVPVDVTVAAVNDPPTLDRAPLSFAEDTELVGILAASDIDGDKLRFFAVGAPNAGGKFSLSSSGDVRWAPPANWNGRDRITFDIDDGHGRVAFEQPLAVTPVNDPPKLRVRDAETEEEKLVVSDAWPEDIDGDKLTLRIEKQGEKSTASVDQKGVVRIKPNHDAFGKDAIVVAVDDGAATATATLRLTITPTPDPPETHADRLGTDEDTVAEATLPGSDPDGDAVTFKLTSTGSLGTAKLLDEKSGRIAYAPNQDAHGEDVVGFEVWDGTDNRRHHVAGALNVTVRPVDDAPTVAPLALATDEDTAARGIVTMSDVDGDALALTLVTPPASGAARVEDAGRGAILFEPARDAHGEVSFVVAAVETASGKLTSAPQTVVVKVAPVNDAPATRGAATTTLEDTPVSGKLTASDIDGDALRWSVTTQPAFGAVTMDERTGDYTYTPRKNAYGPDGFVFTVADGAGGTASARVEVTISPVDDAPAAIPGDLLAPRSGRVTGRLLGRDPEGNPLTFRIVEGTSVGSVKLLDPKTGEYAFSVEGGPKGRVVTFRFVVEAGGKVSEPEQVRIRIE